MVNAPDLQNGFATIGSNKKNSWRTELRSVLVRHQGATSEQAFLTHECRGEAVSNIKIFDGRFYEFAVIKTWAGVFSLRHGSYNFGLRSLLPETIYESSVLDVQVVCKNAEIIELSLDDVLGLCQSNANGRLFLRIDYEYDNIAYTCYTPARYTNFQNASLSLKKYVQPISGYTLFHNGVRFVVGYVAAHIDDKGCHLEFIAREPIGFLDTKPRLGKAYKVLRPFRAILNRLFQTDEFHKIYRMNGKASFFKYV